MMEIKLFRGKIGDTTYAAYGDSWDLLLDLMELTGKKLIDLRVDENTTVEVSNHKHLAQFPEQLSSLNLNWIRILRCLSRPS